MFGGDELEVTLKFENSLIGVVFVKFGNEIFIQKVDDLSFSISVKIAVSSSFYGWIFQFGNKAEIIFPPSVKDEFYSMAMSVCKENAK